MTFRILNTSFLWNLSDNIDTFNSTKRSGRTRPSISLPLNWNNSFQSSMIYSETTTALSEGDEETTGNILDATTTNSGETAREMFQMIFNLIIVKFWTIDLYLWSPRQNIWTFSLSSMSEEAEVETRIDIEVTALSWTNYIRITTFFSSLGQLCGLWRLR